MNRPRQTVDSSCRLVVSDVQFAWSVLMIARSATACLFLALAHFAAGNVGAEQASPRITDPGALAIEMAKALVSGDRDRVTALAATREEMEALLEAAQPPTGPAERQELKDKVAEIIADRGPDFNRFQAMKNEAGVRKRGTVRFELIDLDRIYEKDGMKK